MYCPNCGAENEDTAKFCKKCGQRLRVEKAPARRESPWLTVLVLIAVVAVGGLVVGVVLYPRLKGAVSPPTASPTRASEQLAEAAFTPLPSPTPTPTPDFIRVLWTDDCDPRTDPEFCSLTGSEERMHEILGEFDNTLAGVNATMDVSFDFSYEDLFDYDVVIANFCSPLLRDDTRRQMIADYVTGGGSVIVMGDSFCGGSSGMSWKVANEITEEFGIQYIGRDERACAVPSISHPTMKGASQFCGRVAGLEVSISANVLARFPDGSGFVAVYDGEGTVIAIASTSFHWYAQDDRFVFWQNAIEWLAHKAWSKR